MATIGTRKNKKTGEEEIIIKDVNNDLDKLLDTIYEFRRKEKKKIKSDENKIQNIFIIDKLDLSGLTINRNINFYNCIFEKTVTLNNCIFEKTAIFTKCNFNNPISATTAVFNGITSFNHSKFNGINTNFTLSRFNNKALFNNVDFSSKFTRFEKTQFNDITHFIKTAFYNTVNIGGIFKGNKIRFDNAQFLGDKIKFNGSTFEHNTSFQSCEFYHSIGFKNTTFNQLADFYAAKFFAPQQFLKTDFNEVAIFSNTTFEKEAQFIYCKTKSSSYISFQSAKFKKGFDIARANFNCKVSCWDIQVDDEGLLEAIKSKYYLLDFDFKWWKDKIKDLLKIEQLTDDKIYEIIQKEDNNNIEDDLKEIAVTYKLSINNLRQQINKWTPASKKLRESMRFIKNNFYAENNRIEGLEFERKEMDIYKKEIQKWNLQDKILLWLNSWSNNFGTSWILGIIFTIIIGILCYTLILLSLQKMPLDKIDEDIYNFGQIINIAKWDIKIYGEEIKGWAYISLFIGRIFIGYGYYQTIQAFRKYGKS